MTDRVRLNPTGDGRLAVGDELTEEQIEALKRTTPTADDILQNMDNYNEEIQETITATTEKKASRRKPSSKRRKTSAPKRTARKRNTEVEDLDAELAKLDQQVDATVAEAEEAPVDINSDMRSQILALLKSATNPPSEAQIKQWKTLHGQNGVHVMALGEGDIYIFTHLKRGQWKKIQEMMSKIQSSGQASDVEDQLKEKVISHCTLWPRLNVEFFYNSRAGVADSLYQVILLNSYFLSPQQAMLLTTQL